LTPQVLTVIARLIAEFESLDIMSTVAGSLEPAASTTSLLHGPSCPTAHNSALFGS
jgi:hypothetical protein